MEFLIEIVLEIIFEIIGAIAEGGFYKLSNKYMVNTKTKRITKLVIGTLILIGVIAITIYGLATKKGPIIIASLSYILSIVIVRGVLFFNGKNGKKWIDTLFKWIARILHYGFATTIIVLTAMFVERPVATPLIIALSLVAINILFCVDLNRLHVWEQRKEEKTKVPASDDNDDIFSQYDNGNKLED